MTQRMQKYRKEKKGMVNVRVWVSKEYEYLIKTIAKECRPEHLLKIPERYGRRATTQICLAKSFAIMHQKDPPEHLYDYYVSLSAWMWAHGGKPIK